MKYRHDGGNHTLPSTSLRPIIFRGNGIIFGTLSMNRVSRVTLITTSGVVLNGLLFNALRTNTYHRLTFKNIMMRRPTINLRVVSVHDVRRLSTTTHRLRRCLPTSTPLRPLSNTKRFNTRLVVIRQLRRVVRYVCLMTPSNVLYRINRGSRRRVHVRNPSNFNYSGTIRP